VRLLRRIDRECFAQSRFNHPLHLPDEEDGACGCDMASQCGDPM